MKKKPKCNRTFRCTLPWKIPYLSDKRTLVWGWPKVHRIISFYVKAPEIWNFWSPVDMTLQYGPTDREPLLTGYRAAVFLTAPMNYVYDWIEGRDMEFWFSKEVAPPGYPWHHRMFWPLRDLARRTRALAFTWLAHNGDDWTFWRATKTSICLVFGLEYDHRKEGQQGRYYDSADVAWWGQGDRTWCVSAGPSSWEDIHVAEKWNRWWFSIDSDSSDEGLP